MFLATSPAAVPWWTAAFAVITVADAAGWIYALCLLPVQRRSAVLKVMSLCWLMAPIVCVSVIAMHDLLLRKIRLHAAFFGTPKVLFDAEHLPQQHTWRIDSSLVHWSLTYSSIGFGLMALLTVLWTDQEKIDKRIWVAMGVLPSLYYVCISLI